MTDETNPASRPSAAGHEEMHAAFRLGLGAYVLGGLEPNERAQLEQHLRECGSCREELAAFAVVPALLSRVPADRRVDAPAPPERLLPALLDSARRERSRRTRRWWLAVSSAAAAVIAVVIAVTTLAGQAPRPDAVTMASTSDSAAGSASLQERPWGTAISLEVTGLPPDTMFRAVAVATDGRREPAATWSSTRDGRAVVDGATSIARDELARLDVVTDTGQVLLTTPG